MNFSYVEFMVGRILIVCAISMLLPATLSIILSETDVLAIISSSVITAIIGYAMTVHGINHTMSLTKREAIMTVCFSWVMLSIVGALPYIFSGSLKPFYAILESISGFTTIGSTFIANLSIIPKSVLLWRSMTQWLGGMGVVVLFISFLSQYGSSTISMFNAELPGPSKDRIMPRVKETASLLWKIYTGATILLMILLLLCGLSLFDAISHSMVTISTGGFSSYNNGLRHFNSPVVELLTAFFTIVSACSFYLYYSVYHRGWRKLLNNTEFKVFMLLIFSFTIAVTYDLHTVGGYSFGYSLHNAFFHVASVFSSSGIVITDMYQWPSFSKFLIFLAMFIGGCATSTAGGLKVARVIMMFKIAWLELKRTLYPQTINSIYMNGKLVNPNLLSSISRYLFVFIAVYMIAAGLLTLTGIELLEALLIMASIVGTAGTDIAFIMVPGHRTILDVNDASKVIITFCMLLARLEFFTILVLLRPEFWRKTRNW